jgi:hypothetical protein
MSTAATTAHPAATAAVESAASHAADAAVALRARRATVVGPAEDTVLARRALLKSLISHALPGRRLPAIRGR